MANFYIAPHVPSIAQLVERGTVVFAEILMSLVRIRLEGVCFLHFLLVPWES